MAWYEVESKVRVKDYSKIKKKIKEIAVFKKRETKKDRYFSLDRQGYPKKAFRIRSSGEKHIINFKKWITSLWDKKVVVKEEYEFSVSNPEHFLELMKDLGFKEWVTKEKKSENYVFKKDKKISIELNKIKTLGCFIEIEYLAKKSEIEMAKKKIREVLEELGVSEKDIDNTGYTKMLWKKKH